MIFIDVNSSKKTIKKSLKKWLNLLVKSMENKITHLTFIIEFHIVVSPIRKCFHTSRHKISNFCFYLFLSYINHNSNITLLITAQKKAELFNKKIKDQSRRA
jgi:hypothetical protein